MSEPRPKARHWRTLEDGRVRCEVCPRECTLSPGQRGLCFVRERSGDELVLSAYGKTSGIAVDPIEKKPLYHFYPGSAVLSFGTIGCNLACKFCQNSSISKTEQAGRLTQSASPEEIASMARASACSSVAFTYNEPTIFLEYATDVADACRSIGIKAVAVTAGYMKPAARKDLYQHIDAANVDLKSFSDAFYRRLTGGRLDPVLDTLRYLCRETRVWTEITTLLIPGHNDSDREIGQMCEWIARDLGLDIPLHFTAFRPAFRMADAAPTSAHTLERARNIARSCGLRYSYTGNVHNPAGDTTHCPNCQAEVIVRDRFLVTALRMDGKGACGRCGCRIAGTF